ncbi:hypothetical protein [Pedobacter sp. Leaf250]|uniref:hypothetical protein n=1 Tax=Pedobacter sp. Leaf250 TaxID=2876559 RepID=UPI001E5F218B|nr:hypothetical protein [Pedobacter sp. Leaf250]
MKKLGLIIPILMLSFYTFADTHRYGCWIPETNYIFYEPDLAHGGSPNFLTDWKVPNGDDDGYYEKDARCGNSIALSCTVYWAISSVHPSGNDIRGYGFLADYSIEYCPIDDYIPLLIIFTAGVAFIQIRKKQALV